jgi:polar amino acid transport system substrate-binding protein
MDFRGFPALCVAACLALLLSACGSSSPPASSNAGKHKSSSVPAAYAQLRKLVPASYKKTGVVSVATDASYPPYELYASNNKTIIGVDPDLGHAIGKVLGLRFNFTQVSYDTIPTELQAHRYDIGMSGIGDFKWREKVVDFVDYATFGEGFLTPSSSSFKANDLTEVCGDTISAQSGTSESIQLSQQNKICKNKGKKPITSLTFPSENTAVLAVHSGRSQALFADLATVAWVAKQSPGQFRVLEVHDPSIKGLTGPYGIAFPKGSPLMKPVEGALKLLIANGTYGKIFAKWGVQVDEIKTITVNGATS